MSATKLHATASGQNCGQDLGTPSPKPPRSGLLKCFGCGVARTNSDKLEPDRAARAPAATGSDRPFQQCMVVADSSGSKNLKVASPTGSLKTWQTSAGPPGTNAPCEVARKELPPSPFTIYSPPVAASTPLVCPSPSTAASDTTRSPLTLAAAPADGAAFTEVFHPWHSKPPKSKSSNLHPASAGAVLEDSACPVTSRTAFTASRTAPSRDLSHSLPQVVGSLVLAAAAQPVPPSRPSESTRLPDEESEVIALGTAGREADEDKEEEYGDEAGPRDERARDIAGVSDMCEGDGENDAKREVELEPEQPPGLIASESHRKSGSAVSGHGESSRVAASTVVQAAPMVVSSAPACPRSGLDSIPEPYAVTVRRGASCNSSGGTTDRSQPAGQRSTFAGESSASLVGPGTIGPLRPGQVGTNYPLTPPLRPCTLLRPTPLSLQPPLPAEPLLIHPEQCEGSRPLLPSASKRLAPLTSPGHALIPTTSLTPAPVSQLEQITTESIAQMAPQPPAEPEAGSTGERHHVALLLPSETEPQPLSPPDGAPEDGHVMLRLPAPQPPCFPGSSGSLDPTSFSSAKLPRAGILAALQSVPHSGCHSLPSPEDVAGAGLHRSAGLSLDADASRPAKLPGSISEGVTQEATDQKLNTPRSKPTPTPQHKEMEKEELLRLDPDLETQEATPQHKETVQLLRLDPDLEAQKATPQQKEMEKEELLRLNPDLETQEAAPHHHEIEKEDKLRLDLDLETQEAAVALASTRSQKISRVGEHLHLEHPSGIGPSTRPAAGSEGELQAASVMVAASAPLPEAAVAPDAVAAEAESSNSDDVDSVVGDIPPPPSLRPTPSSVLRGISMAHMRRSSSHELCKPDTEGELQESTMALATLGDDGSVRVGGAMVSGHAAKWLSELPPPAAGGDAPEPPTEEPPPLEPQISVASLPCTESNEDQRPLSPGSVATAVAVVAATGPAAANSLNGLLMEIEA